VTGHAQRIERDPSLHGPITHVFIFLTVVSDSNSFDPSESEFMEGGGRRSEGRWWCTVVGPRIELGLRLLVRGNAGEDRNVPGGGGRPVACGEVAGRWVGPEGRRLGRMRRRRRTGVSLTGDGRDRAEEEDYHGVTCSHLGL
jgi:hypothetical protein